MQSYTPIKHLSSKKLLPIMSPRLSDFLFLRIWMQYDVIPKTHSDPAYFLDASDISYRDTAVDLD